MIARTTNDPAAFQKLVFPYLQRNPVFNSTILTNIADLANRTSNKIYAAIGYRPVRAMVGYAFA